MTVAFLILAFLGSLALAAFCAGAETGFLSVRRGRVLHMARAGGARAKIVYSAIANLGRTTAALLVGNNLASVSYSSASAALSAALFPQSAFLQSVWMLVAAFAILYVGEYLPKLFCSARPLRRMLQYAPVWEKFARVFVPVGAVVQLAVERLMPRREVKAKVTPDAVLRILQDRKDGVKLSTFETVLVGRIMKLRANGEFITPDSLLVALDEGMV